jgi:hypothetical protein
MNNDILPEQSENDKVIIQLLMASIVESRAMMKVILQVISDNDHAVFNKYLESIKKVQEIEYKLLKEELFKK